MRRNQWDGLKSTREIRTLKNYKTRPIIAVTGYSTQTERKHIMEQEPDDFLSKP